MESLIILIISLAIASLAFREMFIFGRLKREMSAEEIEPHKSRFIRRMKIAALLILSLFCIEAQDLLRASTMSVYIKLLMLLFAFLMIVYALILILKDMSAIGASVAGADIKIASKALVEIESELRKVKSGGTLKSNEPDESK